MVAPEREPLRGEVEIDETLVGGYHEGRRGGRQRDGTKTLVGVIVEVRGEGSGRLRLKVLADAGQKTLTPWVEASVEPGAIVHTRRLGRLRQAGRGGLRPPAPPAAA
jgi:hypothetical protein